MSERQSKYHVSIVNPGRRWKIIHRLPPSGAPAAVAEKTYFVARETTRLTCSCPAGRYGRPCKHVRFVADLIGQPALAGDLQPL